MDTGFYYEIMLESRQQQSQQPKNNKPTKEWAAESNWK